MDAPHESLAVGPVSFMPCHREALPTQSGDEATWLSSEGHFLIVLFCNYHELIYQFIHIFLPFRFTGMSDGAAWRSSKRKRIKPTSEVKRKDSDRLWLEGSSDDFVEMSDGPRRQSLKKRKRKAETKKKGPDRLLLEGSSDDFVDADELSSSGTYYGNRPRYSYTYNDNFLSMGFTWTGDRDCPKPKCIVCNKKFANSSMVPSKLRSHLKTKHSYIASKGAPYFEKLLKSQTKQKQSFIGRFTINEKAKEASYLVAEFIAQKRESYTLCEDLIMPACKIIVGKVLGEDAVREIENISLSNTVVSQRIRDMSRDAEEVLCEKLKSSHFSINVHTSTDSANKCHVITFVRYVSDGEIQENFLCYKELPATNQLKDLFHILSSYMTTRGLAWKSCVGICAYSAPSVVSAIRTFATLVKQANPSIMTHCYLHRETLLSKTLSDDMKEVLDNATRIVNFIKHNPAHSQVFKELSKNMDNECISLILHTESGCLSKEVILDRLFQLQDPLLEYFKENGDQDFAKCFEDEEWMFKLAYLADIFSHINQLNESLQGSGENILTASDKVLRFKHKLNTWKHSVAKRDLEMFPLLYGVLTEEGYHHISRHIVAHLDELRSKIQHHFPCISTETYTWVMDPYSETAAQPGSLTRAEEEELCELQSSQALQRRFNERSLDQFWVSVQKRYPALHRKAVNILLQFSSSCACEKAFSCLARIKSTERNRFVSVEDEIRVSLSKVRPRIQSLCSRKGCSTSRSK